MPCSHKAEKNLPDNLYPAFRAGLVMLQTGTELPRAERYLREYMTQEPEAGYPKLSRAHWRLWLVLEKQGHKPEAVSEIEVALKLESAFEPAKKDLKRLK